MERMFIAGEWREGGGRPFEVVNPASEEVAATVASADAGDVDAAVAAARGAFAGDWARVSARDRGRLLWRAGERILEQADEIARLETLHNGKPIFESRHVDIPMAAEVFQYYAGWADKVCGATIPVKGDVFCHTLREPVGVVAAIVPWNFPLLLAAWKIAPALACGNTVIVKPASQTPLTALALARIFESLELPRGAFNVVTGPGAVAGTALARHPGVDKIAFTGETRTGQEIMRGAADHLARVTLELGGKSPNIVFDDADAEAAVRGATVGIFYGKGEVCAAGSRLLVHERVKDQLVERLVERTRKLRPGDPMHPKTRLGAIVSRRQLDTVLGYIDKGKAEGARLCAGGGRADIGTGKGFFLEPTVFDGVAPDMTIAREEIFGPVLATIAFSDEEEAIALANRTSYGLAAGVWTRDLKRAHRVARRLQAGTVWVNTYNVYDAAAPFGGYKQSGFGRELGEDGLAAYTQTKTVLMDLS